jgi:malonyl-CoA O-methyltransferase
MSDPIKRKVRNQFNRAALTYDSHCSLQNAIGFEAIHMLLNFKNNFDTIADFACGTGESTSSLTKHINFKHCYAVDFAEQLLAVAKGKFSNFNTIEWVNCDYDEAINFSKPLDLIFCNMGLQWSCDISKTLKLWQSYLKHHGLVLFSIPIAGNFPELRQTIKPEFLTDNEVTDILETNGLYEISKKIARFEMQFSNPIDAIKSLKATGTNFNKRVPSLNQGLKKLQIDDVFINSQVSQLTYEIGTYLVRSDLSITRSS